MITSGRPCRICRRILRDHGLVELRDCDRVYQMQREEATRLLRLAQERETLINRLALTLDDALMADRRYPPT